MGFYGISRESKELLVNLRDFTGFLGILRDFKDLSGILIDSKGF